ncbi:ceramide kinase-like [Haliotis cracherodii]|uniref:ceramide kinase-like n=1 Tax=Haliotis cracherodii TaxID=6455 RepID=UPI0039EA1EFB
MADSSKPSDEADETCLAGDFMCAGDLVRLQVDNRNICWCTKARRGTTEITIPWRDVITVHRGQTSSKGKDTEDLRVLECFTVHYVHRQPDKTWRHRHKTMEGKKHTMQEWVDVIASKLELTDRPTRLLVIINAIGGRGQGRHIYETKVAPLFELADIQADVIVTQRAGHIGEIGLTYDFSEVNGIIVAGGDGSFSEIINTLVPRVQVGDTDVNNHAAKLSPLQTPIGILPTGTGNELCKRTYNFIDVETVALHIVQGSTVWKDLASVHEEGRLVGLAGVMVAYGYWCHFVKGADQARWLKTLRYPVGVLTSFLKKKREFDAEIEYVLYDSTSNTSEAARTCKDCVQIQGRFTDVNCVLSRLNTNDNEAKALYNPGGMTLVTEIMSGNLQFVKFLLKLNSMRKDSYIQDFIKMYDVTSYKLKVADTDNNGGTSGDGEDVVHLILLDGEIRSLDSLELHVRHQPNTWKLFYSPPTE